MFVALNKDKKRVHISSVLDNEQYYCPICGEELITRKGTTNAHHFAHKNNSNCADRDGWHYDMSDWHYDWQNQFPVDNQEIIFSKNGKIHRADVFINSTVIEFQHSPIKELEFNDRIDFYKNLGYKVIWIFDVIDRDVKYLHGSNNERKVFSWKHPIRFLKKINCNDQNLDVYLQTKEAIWYRQPEYRNIKDFLQLDIDNNIIKISDNSFDGLTTFISDDFYSDVEIIDNYCDLHLLNKKKYPYKKTPNIHKLSDEIYNYKINNYYEFYGYCPMLKDELYNHKECLCCVHIGRSGRCTYRFSGILKEEISEIYDIKYDRDGRVTSVELEINNQRKKYELQPLPTYTKTLLEFATRFKNFRVARFINIENQKIIQLSRYQMNQLIKTKKCYGKLCSEGYRRASNNEFEIFGWNKPIWLLTWYKDENDDYHRSFNKNVNERNQVRRNIAHIKSANNTQTSYQQNSAYNNVNVPTHCPKCGSMISLIEYGGKNMVGCSKYPECDYVAME